MAVRKVWDVEPRENGWAVQRDGTQRADSVHHTQKAAAARAAELATAAGGQVRVKGRDGQIRDERTYGADPHPSKG